MRRLKCFAVTLLAVTLILCLLVPGTFARGGSRPRGLSSDCLAGKKPGPAFADVVETSWAEKHIEKMAVKGIVKGRTDGMFHGRDPVSHAEAVTMIARILGLENQAQSRVQAGAVNLPFSDGAKIPAWAAGYVSEAVERGFLWGPAGKTGSFQPNSPTSRLEVAVMLIRALGLEDEAKAITELPPFHDLQQIPEEFRGHVALAYHNGLLKGYTAGPFLFFRGMQPVSRAEMAAFIDRLDDALPDRDEIEGLLVSVADDGSSLVVEARTGAVTVQLAAEVAVYLNGASATLAELAAGDVLEIQLDDAGLGVFIEAEREDDEQPGYADLVGTVMGIIEATVDSPVKLELEISDVDGETRITAGSQVTLPLADGAVIRYATRVVSLSEIIPGDELELRIDLEERIIQVTIERAEVEGTLVSVDQESRAVAIIINDDDGAAVTYTLAQDGQVFLNGVAATLADLQAGDEVELSLNATGQVLYLSATFDVSDVEGVITSITDTGDGVTIALRTEAGITLEFALDAGVEVRYGDETLSLSDLAIGDGIEVKFHSTIRNRVREVIIEDR
ncbi:MAG: S-layer homology domain-containing protein [Bacillota bacterium]